MDLLSYLFKIKHCKSKGVQEKGSVMGVQIETASLGTEKFKKY